MAASGERKAFYKDDAQMVAILEALNVHRTTCRFCDVLLKVSGEEIYAHSNVLAAASPYFGSFLGHGADFPRVFSQKSPQIIEIHIDGAGNDAYGGYGEAVRKVVDFMYTNNIELSNGILTQVVEIAKIMQMENILEFCESFLRDENNIEEISEGVSALSADVIGLEKPIKCDGDYLKYSANETETLPQISKFFLSTGTETNTTPNNNSNVLNTTAPENAPTVSEEGKTVHQNDTCNYSNTATCLSENEDDNTSAPGPVGNTNTDAVISFDEFQKLISTPKSVSPVKTTDVPLSSFLKTPKTTRTLKNPALKGSAKTTSPGLRRSKRQPSTKHFPVDTEYELQVRASTPKKVAEEKDLNFESPKSSYAYSCDECDFITDRPKTLTLHKRDHLHSNNVCSYCYEPQECGEALQEHLVTHSGPQPFLCTVCEVSFKSRTQLNLHLPKHSTEKPFVCEVCNAGFKWKHALKNHMIVHSGSKDHLCDICGFSTAHKSQLKAHKLIHTGDTFKCNHPGCSFQATKRQNLKYHMLTHTREKPHQCYRCGQSFSLLKNMKRHMLMHEENKPLQCDQCSFNTTRHDKLKEHVRRQHGNGSPPGKKRRISDYETVTQVPVIIGETLISDPSKHEIMEVKLPSGTDPSGMIRVPVTISKQDPQNVTVEYFVSAL